MMKVVPSRTRVVSGTTGDGGSEHDLVTSGLSSFLVWAPGREVGDDVFPSGALRPVTRTCGLSLCPRSRLLLFVLLSVL